MVCELIIKPSQIYEINQICRKSTPAKGFIAAFTFGLSGHVFVDFGDSFTVCDKDGEETKTYVVVTISNENPGIVFLPDDRQIEFENDELVKFRDVEGMTELNKMPPMPVKLCDKTTISICDTSKFGTYTKGGIIESVKQQILMKFLPFEEALKNPL